MNKSKKAKDLATELMSKLEKLKGDRGAMANLRKGMSKTTEDRAWPWIVRWCSGFENDRQRVIYTTVAATYAMHPEPTDKGNLGDTLRQIALGTGDAKKALESFSGRFRRLLSCQTTEDVCRRTGEVVRAAKQKGYSINYAQLFEDLWKWEWENLGGRHPKIQWASAFWNSKSEEGGKS